MKKTLIQWILLFLCLFFIGACQSTQQDAIDRGARYFALTGRTFIYFFQDDLSSCEKFFEVYDQISETTLACDNSGEGSFTFSKVNAQCLEGSPINAVAEFNLQQTNCEDNNTNVIASGDINLSLEFSSKGNFAILKSAGIQLNENLFELSDFRVEIEFSNGDLSCADSADLLVNGESCNVSSDCQTCN